VFGFDGELVTRSKMREKDMQENLHRISEGFEALDFSLWRYACVPQAHLLGESKY